MWTSVFSHTVQFWAWDIVHMTYFNLNFKSLIEHILKIFAC